MMIPNPIVAAFWDTCVQPGARITRQHLYAAFSLWWHANYSGDMPLTPAAFNRAIAPHVSALGQPVPVKGSGYWYGVTVLPSWQPYRVAM